VPQQLDLEFLFRGVFLVDTERVDPERHRFGFVAETLRELVHRLTDAQGAIWEGTSYSGPLASPHTYETARNPDAFVEWDCLDGPWMALSLDPGKRIKSRIPLACKG
jgi:hypothetical protein